jgi:ubiquinone/menaquinone biosynthesis C-methylase UbiE
MTDESDIQRRYYADTAARYEQMHVGEKDEHYFALAFLVGVLDFAEVRSVLDVGSGTGRAIAYIKAMRPGVRVVGLEPVKELREVGVRERGLSEAELCEGDAYALRFADREFDLVCAFGVMHHLETPERAIAEMLRVAKKAVFISDANNFGQGSWAARTVKQALRALRLWGVADYLKTRGKGYTISEGDGLAYSYSLFDNYEQVRRACKSVHLLNTLDAGANLYRTSSHVALLGIR